MLYKFAHIADCHIGANRDPSLQELELATLSKALEECITRKVDFIVISGDIFHSNIPNLTSVNEATKKFKEVCDEGIPIYVVYGSHDYSPNESSIVDVLDSAGLFIKLVKAKVEDEKLKLDFTIDEKTGAKLTGLSARTGGLEERYYKMLDRDSLEKEKGFKIFVFHSALTEFKPEFLANMASIPISYLPKGFDYYAGGHIHQRIEKEWPGYGKIVYPGPLFAGYPRDLEQSALGEKRGFYIISFDEEVRSIDFIELDICEYSYFEYDATGKNSKKAQIELMEKVSEIPAKDKVVLLKIKGELSGGKTSDINFSQLKNLLLQNGAKFVSINRFGLTSKEYASIKVSGGDISEIENRLFKENIGSVKVSVSQLKGEKGFRLASELLKVLRQGRKGKEMKGDYESRIIEQAIEVLQLKEAFK